MSLTYLIILCRILHFSGPGTLWTANVSGRLGNRGYNRAVLPSGYILFYVISLMMLDPFYLFIFIRRARVYVYCMYVCVRVRVRVCVRARVCCACMCVCARARVVCVCKLFKPTGAVRHEPHSPLNSVSTAGRFNVPSAGCCEGAGGTGSIETDRLQITHGGINIR